MGPSVQTVQERRAQALEQWEIVLSLARLSRVAEEPGRSEDVVRHLLDKTERNYGRNHRYTIEAIMLLAWIYEDDDRIADAQRLYADAMRRAEKAEENRNTSIVLVNAMMSKMYLKHGELGLALEHITRAIDLLEKDDSWVVDDRVGALCLSALIHAYRQDFAQAERDVTKAYELKRHSVEVFEMRALVIALQGRWNEAAPDLELAVRYNLQTGFDAMCSLWICKTMQGRGAEADAWIADAVHRLPPNYRKDFISNVAAYLAGDLTDVGLLHATPSLYKWRDRYGRSLVLLVTAMRNRQDVARYRQLLQECVDLNVVASPAYHIAVSELAILDGKAPPRIPAGEAA